MSKQRFHILIGMLTLMLGALIYVICRADSYVGHWFDDFAVVIYARRRLEVYSCDIIEYYFPDFLWGLSLCSLLMAIHTPGFKGTLICGGIAFLCGCLWEVLQYLQIVWGTGDVIDMLMYLLANSISIILNVKERKT